MCVYVYIGKEIDFIVCVCIDTDLDLYMHVQGLMYILKLIMIVII